MDGKKRADDVVAAVVVVDGKFLFHRNLIIRSTTKREARIERKFYRSFGGSRCHCLLLLLLAFAIGGLGIERRQKFSIVDAALASIVSRESGRKTTVCVCVCGVRRSWSQQCVNPISFYDFISFFVASAATRKSLFTLFSNRPRHTRARRYSLSFA